VKGGKWQVVSEKEETHPPFHATHSKNGGKLVMKKRGKTNRLKAALKRKNVKSSLRKSKGERKYPT
jgi:hypothetical protein